MFYIAVPDQKVFALEGCILLLVVEILLQDAPHTWKTCSGFLATLLLLLAFVCRDLPPLRLQKLLMVDWVLGIACQTPLVILLHQMLGAYREKMAWVVGLWVVRLVGQPYLVVLVAFALEASVQASGSEGRPFVVASYQEVLSLLEIYQIHQEVVLVVPYPQEDAIHLELWQLSSF